MENENFYFEDEQNSCPMPCWMFESMEVFS